MSNKSRLFDLVRAQPASHSNETEAAGNRRAIGASIVSDPAAGFNIKGTREFGNSAMLSPNRIGAEVQQAAFQSGDSRELALFAERIQYLGKHYTSIADIARQARASRDLVKAVLSGNYARPSTKKKFPLQTWRRRPNAAGAAEALSTCRAWRAR